MKVKFSHKDYQHVPTGDEKIWVLVDKCMTIWSMSTRKISCIVFWKYIHEKYASVHKVLSVLCGGITPLPPTCSLLTLVALTDIYTTQPHHLFSKYLILTTSNQSWREALWVRASTSKPAKTVVNVAQWKCGESGSEESFFRNTSLAVVQILQHSVMLNVYGGNNHAHRNKTCKALE